MKPAHMSWAQSGFRTDLAISTSRHTFHGDDSAHDHEWVEVGIALAGSGTHETLYASRPIQRGDAYTIQPGAWHTYRDCDRLQLVFCCFRPHLLEHELLWLADDPAVRLLLWPNPAGGDGIVSLHLSDEGLRICSKALDELAAPPADDPRLHQTGQLLLLLHELARHVTRKGRAGAERPTGARTGVEEAVQLMTNDLARRWTLNDLAAAVTVSPSHLSRMFQRAVGRPPMAHLAVLRAEAAATQLLRTLDSMSAIAAAVGWGDPNYFSRRFRAHFGMSPTAYRRSRRRQSHP
jgi:AraC family L-rhamnose operon transcriptional activator RhaR